MDWLFLQMNCTKELGLIIIIITHLAGKKEAQNVEPIEASSLPMSRDRSAAKCMKGAVL